MLLADTAYFAESEAVGDRYLGMLTGPTRVVFCSVSAMVLNSNPNNLDTHHVFFRCHLGDSCHANKGASIVSVLAGSLEAAINQWWCIYLRYVTLGAEMTRACQGVQLVAIAVDIV